MPTAYVNARGASLSSAPGHSFWAANPGQTTSAPGGGHTLYADALDDTFYLYTATDQIVLPPLHGIDTVDDGAWNAAYTLPAGIQTLVLSGANQAVTGNALDNLIVAQSGPATLAGGGGDDVFVDGAGPDTIIDPAGSGDDVIYGFKPGIDHVRLDNNPRFNDFAAVLSAMTRSGADTALDLGAGQTLIFRNHGIADFRPDDFYLPIQTAGMTATFDDPFNALSASPSGTGAVWTTTLAHGARTLSGNHEAEFYADASVGPDPFSVSDGVLDIHAAPASQPGGLAYTSGILTTQNSFAQLYGYFEIRAQLPSGAGFWPAFWLLPASGAWPPEADVMEQVGSQPTTDVVTAHTNDGGFNTSASVAVDVPDTSAAFHTYGLDWTASTLTWYFDGNEIARASTPSDMHTPMYMLVNLAVGGPGSWPGPPAQGASADLLIDDIRAYAYAPAIAPAAETLPPPAADPLFDPVYYCAHNPDVAAAGVDPARHYATMGWKEGRNPDAFFDTTWYLTQNPDVRAAGVDPLLHFATFGWKEGRDPSLLFSASRYLAANPDVQAAAVDPLAHDLMFGQSEGRMSFLAGAAAPADPLVNPAFYDREVGATLVPTGAAASQQAAYSYDHGGWQRGLNPNAWFDTRYYLTHNPDAQAAGIDPLQHYETYGWTEGRDPSAQFSTSQYLAAYADVKAAAIDPLLHFVANGQAEGRSAFPAYTSGTQY